MYSDTVYLNSPQQRLWSTTGGITEKALHPYLAIQNTNKAATLRSGNTSFMTFSFTKLSPSTLLSVKYFVALKKESIKEKYKKFVLQGRVPKPHTQ